MDHCMKEIRSRKGPTRWKGCNRKACVEVKSKYIPKMYLTYCKRHAPKRPVR